MELGDFHRYLLPKYQNQFTDENLSVWAVNQDEAFQLISVCEIEDGYLKFVTFKCTKQFSGRLEIRDDSGTTIFYSNCVEFINSTDEDGRKFIRIATKHTYNRNLFDYQGEHNWIITSVPAYCLGMTSVDADISNSRTGGISTLKIRETFLDEITEYEFISRGDANVLNFLQVHSTNNEFYIDGTKRTCTDKIDRDEFSIAGRLKFTNVKDQYGFNILLDYDDVLADMYDSIYADNVAYDFTYSHEPDNDPNSGERFLTNLLFNNYHNAFGILYDCDLKIRLVTLPVKGFLAHNITKQIFAPGDEISYCDKDDLVYYPNGFDNNLGVTGNYVENFSYRIVDQADRVGRLITHTISMTDTAVEPVDISVSISWDNGTSTDLTGNAPNVLVVVSSLVFDPLNPVVTQQWEVWNGTAWVFYADKTTDLQTINLPYEVNKVRLKVVAQFGEEVYSNILQYTRTISSNIYITDKVYKDNGVVTYKLHVENETFVGFANMIGEKVSNVKNAIINDTRGGALAIPAVFASGDIAKRSIAVNIPVGVYDCEISAKGVPLSYTENLELIGAISYNYNNEYYYGQSAVEVQLYIPSI